MNGTRQCIHVHSFGFFFERFDYFLTHSAVPEDKTHLRTQTIEKFLIELEENAHVKWSVLSQQRFLFRRLNRRTTLIRTAFVC